MIVIGITGFASCFLLYGIRKCLTDIILIITDLVKLYSSIRRILLFLMYVFSIERKCELIRLKCLSV